MNVVYTYIYTRILTLQLRQEHPRIHEICVKSCKKDSDVAGLSCQRDFVVSSCISMQLGFVLQRALSSKATRTCQQSRVNRIRNLNLGLKLKPALFISFWIVTRSLNSFQQSYLMAPCTRVLLKNLAKRLVTSSRSAARSTNASTFVRHLTSRLLNNLCPGSLVLPPSAEMKNHIHVMCQTETGPIQVILWPWVEIYKNKKKRPLFFFVL